jgi:hypothetical protein
VRLFASARTGKACSCARSATLGDPTEPAVLSDGEHRSAKDEHLFDRVPAGRLSVKVDGSAVVVGVKREDDRRAVLVDDREAAKAAGLPDADQSPRFGDHRLDSEVVDGHRWRLHRRALLGGESQGQLDVVRGEVR